MRKRSASRLAALVAALMLVAAVSTASANRLSVNESRVLMEWARLTFESAMNITCYVSLAGSFHSRTITKVLRSLVGAITSATVGECEGDGRATVLTATLPWHFTYNGFVGRLPIVTAVRLLLIHAAFRVEDGTACLARTSATQPLGITANVNERGEVTTLDNDRSFAIDLEDEVFLCSIAGDARISGSGIICKVTGGPVILRLI